MWQCCHGLMFADRKVQAKRLFGEISIDFLKVSCLNLQKMNLESWGHKLWPQVGEYALSWWKMPYILVKNWSCFCSACIIRNKNWINLKPVFWWFSSPQDVLRLWLLLNSELPCQVNRLIRWQTSQKHLTRSMEITWKTTATRLYRRIDDGRKTRTRS